MSKNENAEIAMVLINEALNDDDDSVAAGCIATAIRRVHASLKNGEPRSAEANELLGKVIDRLGGRPLAASRKLKGINTERAKLLDAIAELNLKKSSG